MLFQMVLLSNNEHINKIISKKRLFLHELRIVKTSPVKTGCPFQGTLYISLRKNIIIIIIIINSYWDLRISILMVSLSNF